MAAGHLASTQVSSPYTHYKQRLRSIAAHKPLSGQVRSWYVRPTHIMHDVEESKVRIYRLRRCLAMSGLGGIGGDVIVAVRRYPIRQDMHAQMTSCNDMQNPFYNSTPTSSSSPTIPPPPSYSTRPAPSSSTPVSEPAQYSSLSDLTKNRPKPPSRPNQGFSYTPDPTRQGYDSGVNSYAPVGGDGRRMPPPPSNYGVGVPSEPPRRKVAASPAPTPPSTAPASGPASYLPASAQGYANTASTYAQAGVGRAKDSFDSMFTQQRREQVTSGLGKAAAGGAKLLGQGAWKLGKFASNPSGK